MEGYALWRFPHRGLGSRRDPDVDTPGFQAGEAADALSILGFGYRPLAAFVAQRGKKSGGWRKVKILSSGECSKIRDCCIFCVNDLEVFL